jgi:hypothetical protein
VTERHIKFLNPEEAVTEIVKFKCVQCGNCCLNLYDAFCTTADPEDLIRWEKEGRWDIKKKGGGIF